MGDSISSIGQGLGEHDFAARVEAIFGGRDSLGLHIEAVDSSEPLEENASPAAESAVRLHQEILQTPGIHEINAAANFGPDEAERLQGLDDEWRADEFAGTDQHSEVTNVVAVGTVAAGMDVVITKVMEEPVHAALDKEEHWRLGRKAGAGTSKTN